MTRDKELTNKCLGELTKAKSDLGSPLEITNGDHVALSRVQAECFADQPATVRLYALLYQASGASG